MDKIPYVDFPELKFNKYESTQMPFRYVTNKEGEPIMPKVWIIGLGFEAIRLTSGRA